MASFAAIALIGVACDRKPATSSPSTQPGAKPSMLWEADYSHSIGWDGIPVDKRFGGFRSAEIQGPGLVKIKFSNDLTLFMMATRVYFSGTDSRLECVTIESLPMHLAPLRNLIEKTAAECGVDLQGLNEWCREPPDMNHNTSQFSRTRTADGYGVGVETVYTFDAEAPYMMHVIYAWDDPRFTKPK